LVNRRRLSASIISQQDRDDSKRLPPMGRIDVHTHAFPDKLAGRAIETLELMCPWKAIGDGTIDGLLRSMDQADIDVSVVCNIATKPNQVRNIFKWCKQIHSDRIEPLASVHPKTKRPGKWLAKFARAGLAGIKLHPMYQEFCLDDASLEEVYQAATEYGLIVATHCGQDIGFPPDDDRASPRRAARVLDRHPKLKLLCTHMGGWKSWDEVDKHLIGRDVYLETSFSLAHMEPERAASMIARHGPGRVMLGSDWPWSAQEDEICRVMRLGLDEARMQAVFWKNAARLLGY